MFARPSSSDWLTRTTSPSTSTLLSGTSLPHSPRHQGVDTRTLSARANLPASPLIPAALISSLSTWIDPSAPRRIDSAPTGTPSRDDRIDSPIHRVTTLRVSSNHPPTATMGIAMNTAASRRRRRRFTVTRFCASEPIQ
jgi:hypothetical protein